MSTLTIALSEERLQSWRIARRFQIAPEELVRVSIDEFSSPEGGFPPAPSSPKQRRRLYQRWRDSYLSSTNIGTPQPSHGRLTRPRRSHRPGRARISGRTILR